MPVNSVYRITARFTAPEADGEMNFNVHYRMTANISPVSEIEEATELGQAFNNDVSLNYMSLVPDDVTFIGSYVVGISNPQIGVLVNTSTGGGGGLNPLPYRSAPVLKFLTGTRGRSFQGRIYLMTIDESQQTSGVMLSTYITSIETFAASLLTQIGLVTTNEYSLTIFSPTLTGTGPVVDNLVTARQLNPQLGSVRSRQNVI